MGQIVIIMILLTLQVLMFLYFRMMIRRELSQENRIDSVRREIEQLIIELDRTTDRNIELIENRIGQLKESLKKGDKILRLIDSEQEKRENAPSLYTNLKNLQQPPPEDSPLIPDDVIATGQLPGLGLETIDIEVIDGKERALELFLQGMEPALIATSTGLPRGEVELIISLHGKG